MTSYELPTGSGRPSDAERDRAVELLREHAVQGRLSHDTFVARMELAIRATDRSELQALMADLPADRMSGWATRAVGATATFSMRLRAAWRAARLPALMLPDPGPKPLLIGRDLACGLRIADESVSRSHAELRLAESGWLLRDLGSLNGTWVNGARVTGATRVRPGDTVAFGQVGYRLAGG